MKTFFLIFFLASSTFGVLCFDRTFSQKAEDIRTDAAEQDLLAATNHNWSNQ